jgi:hypothetical protein
MDRPTFELARRRLGSWPAAPLIAGSYAVAVVGGFAIAVDQDRDERRARAQPA